MNHLIENQEIILTHLKETCGDIKSFYQIRTPKLSNLALTGMNLTAKYMTINTELQLFKCLKGSYLEPMIERSKYNKRRKKLFDYTEAIRKCLSEKFACFTDVFVVDSMPTPICKYAGARRRAICSTYEIQPSYGYCPCQKSKYFGYKFHGRLS